VRGELVGPGPVPKLSCHVTQHRHARPTGDDRDCGA
jgi:hypothetical protein